MKAFLFLSLILFCHHTAAFALSEVNAKAINEQFQKSVKPIFAAKCAVCHGKVDAMPWYYALPGLRQLMNHHLEEAKEHIDMSSTFPFKSEKDWSPEKQLEKISDEVQEAEMPPWYFRITHWNAKLTTEEQIAVLEWAKSSSQLVLKDKENTRK